MLILPILLLVIMAIDFHTNTLVTTHHSKKLAQGHRKIKIAHVTDLHSGKIGRLEKQLFYVLVEEKPDVIFITGDLATPNGDIEEYKKLLKKFKAPKGVYFVYGNWEYWEPIKGLDQLLLDANILNLTNKTKKLDENLWLVGFDDSETGSPNLEILSEIPSNTLKLALFHSPQFFESLTGKINIGFAGHGHGGQIRIPFLNALWVPAGTGKFTEGWFEKAGSHLFVSRGIGTSILPIRFNCSPELAIITIEY